MEYETLATQLSARTRLGMSEALADKLRMKSYDAVRYELLAMTDGARGPLGVHLLAVYVIDDTDFWSDGEIYWWSIPTLVTKSGGATWNATYGLPNGAPPQKCGDLEWLTSVALKDPPLLAVIPPDDEVASCVIRLAVYDDDGPVADFPKAMEAGYEALASCKPTGLTGAENVLGPVRDAIFGTLKGNSDDILVEQDLTLRREDARFGVGLIGAISTLKARVYYFVKDEIGTQTMGPVALQKDETRTLKLEQPAQSGGSLAIFARGGGKDVQVSCGVFGTLTTDKPFLGEVLDAAKATQLNGGIPISANGEVSVVAYYTPRPT